MTLEQYYVIGTMAIWLGGIALLRGLYLALVWMRKPPGYSPEGTRSGLWLASALAAISLLIALTIPMQPERSLASGWKLPLIWPVMPFLAWAALTCLIVGLVEFFRATIAPFSSIRRARIWSGLLWIASCGLSFFLFSQTGDSIQILRGAIALQPILGLGLIGLLVLVVVALVATAQTSVTKRSAARVVLTHAALIGGSIVFGLPFAWMIITSFKEDQDIAFGIDWIPKVSETAEYFDPKEPIFEGEHQGVRVQGPVIDQLPNGQLLIDIFRPAVMRGVTFIARREELIEVPKRIPIIRSHWNGVAIQGRVIEELDGGSRRIRVDSPTNLRGKEFVALPQSVEPVRHVGLDFSNYPSSLEYLPPEAKKGLVYLRNTLILVVCSVIGTVLSSALVAYGFSRMTFPGKRLLFTILLSTMMLPAAVTILPNFLIFRWLGWIDTLYPLWVPTFFAGAFNVFLLNQFFKTIPMELEDAAKIDGCSYFRTFWRVMLPQIKPALAVIAIWTFMGAWNNFMGPLIFISSPENMPVAYALQLFQTERGSEQGMMMAFATMSMLPVVALYFFAQKYFVEGVTLSGMGGR